MRLQTPVRRGAYAAMLGFLGVLASATAVIAQSIVNPTTLEFSPSADHDLTVGGTAVVDRYDVAFYQLGAAQPFQVNSLGKPAPGTGGLIRVALSSLSSLPSPGITYEARVIAVGPGGAGTSSVSNTFAFTQPCSFSVTPTTQSVVSAGATGSVSVSAGTGCAWMAASNAGWITITSGASGSGNGPVGYSVAANATTSVRSATLTVAGQTVTISQAALTCTYTALPATQSVGANGGQLSVSVTAPGACSWTASSSASWLTISSGGTGSGNGAVSLSAAANTSTASRTATVSVGGQAVSVTQVGACAYTVSPTSVTLNRNAASGTIAVTTTAGCAWTAMSNSSWITVTSGASGAGNGSVGYTAAASPTTSARTGTLTIAGQTVSLTQPQVDAPAAPSNLRFSSQ